MHQTFVGLAGRFQLFIPTIRSLGVHRGMCGLLATQEAARQTGSNRQLEAAPASASDASESLPGLSLRNMAALAPLLPLNTAFQLLVSPMLARGVGMRLKSESLYAA